MNPYYSCPVCNSKNFSILFDEKAISNQIEFTKDYYRRICREGTSQYLLKDHSDFIHFYDAKILQCSNCLHLTRDPFLSDADLMSAYQNDEYHPQWLEAMFEPYVDSFRASVDELVLILSPSARILEIGSQIGGFQEAVKRKTKWQSIGIDINNQFILYGKARGHNVEHTAFDQFATSDGEFDAIFVWSCFEMLPDPVETLKKIWSSLAKGGLLQIVIPNGEFMAFIKEEGIHMTDIGLILLSHTITSGFPFRNGYSRKSVEKLFDEAKFASIEITNTLYYPVTSDKILKSAEIKSREFLIEAMFGYSQRYKEQTRGRLINPWISVVGKK